MGASSSSLGMGCRLERCSKFPERGSWAGHYNRTETPISLFFWRAKHWRFSCWQSQKFQGDK